ncbi:unnamed protein product [Trichogramma brassicae]|uniref:Uncharacterized protein n=1 Tax=Trichogramma brassicae TaxID=86971 RepID=A0A6H5ICR8_9HYME|nr:unnamed protein product [Trichogramma brassicae]
MIDHARFFLVRLLIARQHYLQARNFRANDLAQIVDEGSKCGEDVTLLGNIACMYSMNVVTFLRPAWRHCSTSNSPSNYMVSLRCMFLISFDVGFVHLVKLVQTFGEILRHNIPLLELYSKLIGLQLLVAESTELLQLFTGLMNVHSDVTQCRPKRPRCAQLYTIHFRKIDKGLGCMPNLPLRPLLKKTFFLNEMAARGVQLNDYMRFFIYCPVNMDDALRNAPEYRDPFVPIEVENEIEEEEEEDTIENVHFFLENVVEDPGPVRDLELMPRPENAVAHGRGGGTAQRARRARATGPVANRGRGTDQPAATNRTIARVATRGAITGQLARRGGGTARSAARNSPRPVTPEAQHHSSALSDWKRLLHLFNVPEGLEPLAQLPTGAVVPINQLPQTVPLLEWPPGVQSLVNLLEEVEELPDLLFAPLELLHGIEQIEMVAPPELDTEVQINEEVRAEQEVVNPPEQEVVPAEQEVIAPPEQEMVTSPEQEVLVPTQQEMVASTEQEVLAPTQQEMVASTEQEVVAQHEQEVLVPTQQEKVASTEQEVVAQHEQEVFVPTQQEVIVLQEQELVAPSEPEVNGTNGEPARKKRKRKGRSGE